MEISQIARICHEVNRAYCIGLGDLSQPTWDEAPEWQKSSCINGIVYHLSNPDSKPSDSHENWMKEKQENGWIYGPVKDPEKKEHPCMVPYDQLPEEQKVKDLLFITIIRAFKDKDSGGMSFGRAISFMKSGYAMSRKGWHKNGLFVFMQVPATISKDIVPNMQSLPSQIKEIFSERFELWADSINYSCQMAIVFPDNTIKGWAPSVSDVLAEDWFFVV